MRVRSVAPAPFLVLLQSAGTNWRRTRAERASQFGANCFPEHNLLRFKSLAGRSDFHVGGAHDEARERIGLGAVEIDGPEQPPVGLSF